MADVAFTSFGFKATGATTNRTMPDRLAEIKNVKDFGATGDGSTNDTLAIQAAIDWTSNADRGTIYFPIGTYKVTAPLTFNYAGALSICFRGEGNGSFISGTTSSGYTFDRHLGSPSNQARVTFDKLNITNNDGTAGTGSIRVGSSISVVIRDCLLGGVNPLTTEDSAGVSSQNIFIQDIRMTGGTDGVIMGGGGVITGSDIHGCTTGFRLYGPGWVVIGCRVERCDTAYLLGLDSAGTDVGASGFSIMGGTTEGNKISIDVAGTCSAFYIGQLSFLPHIGSNSGVSGTENPERGIYIRANKASSGVLNGIAAGGDACTIAQIQIDASTTRANILVEECTATVLAGGGATFVYPSNAYTAHYLNCSEQPTWTFSKLPAEGGANVLEGDEFSITDGAKSGGGTALWGDNVQGGGTQHLLVRYNGTHYTAVGT